MGQDQMKDEDGNEDIVRMPIDGTLDLHTFHPRDVKPLVQDYLEECQRLGLIDVRVVHGKGTGSLRRSVHAILDRLDIVESFRIAGEGGGGWGATLVRLHAAGH
ncbi:MAG: Smr/MutS family protein [Candidatus Latescibacterota bacterium]|jgi:dsDNA-specific endonuclease/ATPase MutS2|nr:Smr/MutS family protein [Candidatus Latescibacterota bacterium]MEE3041490.1 Smr/MutS family protein [Candidatus Latescibacterota bacterium]MEE3262005.1 Smr/MutS family protein [Candidatus Latescibacterota bacterium]MEE3335933.1 Smr/MutS family protein [Candidatus Latescibacterota bacterium]|tara:strand:- start:132 stop:443 length:312 start_codon:yes stop_codon:yes gene_type:complete